MTIMTATNASLPADWRDLFALTKPRVMRSVVFTAACGLIAAPGSMSPALAIAAVLCIAGAAGSAGALNQWYEADIDARMTRTADRPLPAGRVDRQSALHFGVGLGGFSIVTMYLATNALAAVLLAASIAFYVLIYTMWLKPRTPQNIVIGGAAGAFPPLIGWVAATGTISTLPLIMFAMIFLWTPPHSWALALIIRDDYRRGDIPMLPVVASGRTVRAQMLVYTVLMIGTMMAPWALGFAGIGYASVAGATSAIFFALTAWCFIRNAPDPAAMKPERTLFVYSIGYILVIFAALAIDQSIVA